MNDCFVLKGNICQTLHPKELDLHENAYAVCVVVFQKVYLILCLKNIPPCRFMITVTR